MRLETLAVHAGLEPDASTGAVVPPIHLSTTYERAEDGSFPSGWVYAREGNPNRAALEHCVAQLEGGQEGVAFASGMAASAAVLQALEPGDRILVADDAYYGTGRLLRQHLSRWGLVAEFVDMTDRDAVRSALDRGARLVWLETPSNPLIRITDLEAVAQLARASGAWVACDNTWATPMLQRPLELGADLVVHATTKYLSGHSDVTGGVVVLGECEQLGARVRELQADGGAIPSPLDCWLTLRGVRTLPCRMRVHCQNAEAVARCLSRHARVERVHYPGLEDSAGHRIACRQMRAFGGMVSFEVEGGERAAMAVAARLSLITRATSLGGPESLIEHRASIEGEHSRSPKGLLRMSVGLEHPDDLVADLEQALA